MMNDYQTNPLFPYFLSVFFILGCSIGYSTSGINIDTTQSLLPFVLLLVINILSVNFGIKVLDGIWTHSNPIDKIFSGLLIMVIPFILVDLSASIFIPTMNLGAYPIRTLAIGIIGLIDLITLFSMKN